jgi:PIN domain nuclease of toxin-antitoxin system
MGHGQVIVLDTHAWLWWTSGSSRLGGRARLELNRAKRIGVPAICCLEVATGVAHGRIELDRAPLDWMRDALAQPRVELLPITPAIAAKAAELPDDFPGDPADRLIAATAILESALLLTRDDRIRKFAGVRTVW